ncbi:MAG: ABC transporter ATP-binding protein [Neofamilia sp.]
MMLKVKNLSVSFSDIKILEDINFEISENDWLMIIGPNGAGKTTITNAIAQSIPYTGSINLNGKEVEMLSPKERAKEIGVLMQNHHVTYDFKVKDVVGLGAYSRSRGILGIPSLEEEDILKESLLMTGMENFENRSILTLSGG